MVIPLADLVAVNAAFAAEAARTGPDSPVRSEIWPTAGRMIDHLGNIQAWATEIVRTGVSTDRAEFRRPVDRDRVDWFTETSTALVDTLDEVDPGRACWTVFDAPPVTAFWRRRMTNEAAKHLWDLRTAIDSDPRMPVELGLDAQAGILDEFADVLVPFARARGLEPLPHALAFIADDIDRRWVISPDWVMATPGDVPAGADVLRADVGDLALFAWERASPWALPARYLREGPGAALEAFSRTPVHL